MVNKRGQELSIGTIILIILGLAVLVFLIIGFTKGWDFFFGNIGRIDPGKLEAVAQACKGYVDAELTIAYCTFRDVGGDEYVNCEDERIKKVLSEAGLTALGTCTNKEDFCNGQGDGRDKLVINNGDIKCASYCGGTATACDKITDSAKCGDSDTTGQLGCKWDTTNLKCTKTATACDKITDSTKCGDSDTTGQLGCKWVEIPVR